MMRPQTGGRTSLDWLIIVAVVVGLVTMLAPSPARADIYQWEWVDPSDHSLGKTQSSVLCPDGAGVTAGRGSVLSQRDLTQAYLYGRDLSFSTWTNVQLENAYFCNSNLNQMLLYFSSARGADFTAVNGMGHFRFSDLTGADFTDAKLKHFSFSTLDNANFTRADLSNGSIEQGSFHGANFTDANINGLYFYGATIGGFTEAQLHQTASYKNRDLSGVRFLGDNNMSGWDFAGVSGGYFQHANLTGARFNSAGKPGFLNCNLTSADFSGATLGYLEANDLTGANFSGANLTNAFAQSSNWTNANLSGAIIAGANLMPGDEGALTAEQIYSTASYRNRDLRGINLSNSDLSAWSFRGVDLSDADLRSTLLVRADLSRAILTNTTLVGARLHDADFSETELTQTSLTRTDLRGARNMLLAGADVRGAIFPDGTARGLGPAGSAFTVENYSGSPAIPVRIQEYVNRPTRIRFVFDMNPWQSVVTFDPGILVDVTGTNLRLNFENWIDPTNLFGQTFQVFDWGTVDPIGQFDLSNYSEYHWDLSRLYSHGQVTLIGVPEPSQPAVLLAALAIRACGSRRRLRVRTSR